MRHLEKAYFDNLRHRLPSAEIVCADNFFALRCRNSASILTNQVLEHWNIAVMTVDENADEPQIRNHHGKLNAVVPCSFSRRPGNTSHYDIQTSWYLLRAIFRHRLQRCGFSSRQLELDQASRILAERALYGNHSDLIQWLSSVGMTGAHDYFEHPYSLTGTYLPKIAPDIAAVTFCEKWVSPVCFNSPAIPIQRAKRTHLFAVSGIGDNSRRLKECARFLLSSASKAIFGPSVFPAVRIDGVDGFIASVSYVARQGVHEAFGQLHTIRRVFLIFLPLGKRQLFFGSNSADSNHALCHENFSK